MPRLVEMGKLEARCQRRADLEPDDHIDHEEWLELISEAWGELFSLVANAGLRYFETLSTFTSDASNVLDEPGNVQAVIGLWKVEASGKRRRLRPVGIEERSMWSGRTGDARRYELVDDMIYLYPTPPAGQTYELLYIPAAPDLSGYASDACVDCVIAEGEAFVIWGTLVKAKAKSESDVRLAVIERDRLAKLVDEWAKNRLMLEPSRRIVVDVDYDEVGSEDW